MTAPFKRIIITAILLIAIAGIACMLVMSKSCSPTAKDPLANMKVDAINTIVDVTGVKEQLDSALRDKTGVIAEQTGIPQSQANEIIDNINIPAWKATTLPDGAHETGSYGVNAEGVSARITTYDDPSIVTVNAYGQSATMAIPESAQGYITYLQFCQ